MQHVVPVRSLTYLFSLSLIVAVGCGGGGDGDPLLEDFLPDLPVPTGESQAVWAGVITPDNADAELIPGPATSGMVGDYYLRNTKVRFVIQSAARVIGVVPQGGNVVDAVPLDAQGGDLSDDHFGELSAVYQVMRTCEHDTVEILQDGSAGGAAVIRAIGHSAVNDYINIKGMAVLSIPPEIDGDWGDQIECATTYVLPPDEAVLRVYFTYLNPDELSIEGPFGLVNDTGGETEQFAPTRGFERLGVDSLTSLTEPVPIDYVVYQGPGVAYGIVPSFDDSEGRNAAVLIAGVSVVLYGVDSLLDILAEEGWFFSLEGRTGLTHSMTLVVGQDAASVEREFQRDRGAVLQRVAGTVQWVSGETALGARVGLFEDLNDNGALDDEDVVRTYLDVDLTGAFSGTVAAGNYLVRAEVKNLGRSEATTLELASSDVTDLSLELPDPVYYDFSILDDETGNVIPGRITIVGEHPAYPDGRLFETADRTRGVVQMLPAQRGTSVELGDGTDPRIALAPGSTYRVMVSRGTEWSVASQVLTPTVGDPDGDLEFRLRHVVPTSGYLSTEFHQHSVGSPDSPVPRAVRVATFAAEGVEFFASTDHDYVTDFQPLIELLGLDRIVRCIPGLEVTPFAYGHFQAYPIEPSDAEPSGGAVDWARGTAGYAMIPSEIWQAARDRGAEVIQINHPRRDQGSFTDMMQYFDRAGLVFDYDARVVGGDPLRVPVPLDWLRLPEASVWDDSFNALEVWNDFTVDDTNEDGVREIANLDLVLRDWFNFLSFGMTITPVGNSDSHSVTSSPVGMPRTLVRVANDDASAVASGSVIGDVLDTLSGLGGAPRDVVVTNGPHLAVEQEVGAGSVVGLELDGSSGSVTFTVTAMAPAWAEIDTLEMFVNTTPDTFERKLTWLQPAACVTSREISELPEQSACALAPLGVAQGDFELVATPAGSDYRRYQVTTTFTLTAEQVASVNREGASGTDAWVVFRVRGNRAVFPLVMDRVVTEDNLETLVTGDASAIDEVLREVGIPATAFTSPVYIDFDGGGYTAPFEP